MVIAHRDNFGICAFYSAGRRLTLIFFLPISFALLSCNNTTAETNQAIAQNLGSFFEAYLGRRVSDAERRSLAEEFVRLHTAKGRNREAIEQIARKFASYVKILREQKDGAADLSLRHALLQTNYFQPTLKDTIELRLFTEPDPVRVVDSRSKRLMTEKDIIAIINLNHFSNSSDDPRHLTLSRQQIDRLAIGLNRIFGDQPKAGSMPGFCSEAAALWAGIRQEWPNLNANERRQTRAYAGKGSRAPLPSHKMYARLLGIDASAAFERRLDDLSAVALYLAELNALGTVITTEMSKMR
ncbi:MAG TPA: hypothetical protein VJ302_07425 [Blastocatellia bacterium]|nr:hypothetical protein [Blastocatellia bacterium]